jgi:hypothetical protein
MSTFTPLALAATFAPRIVRRSAPASWGATARGELARQLRKVGVTLTELSDARELLGHARLSEGSDWDREHALENLECPAMIFALAEVHAERATLLASLKAIPTSARRAAHDATGLRGERDLRLPELRALHAAAVLAELGALGAPAEALVEAEYLAGAPVEYGHSLTPAEVADAEDCFTRAGAL